MVKLLLLIIGLAAGALGASGWLVSKPEPTSAPGNAGVSPDRIAAAKARWREAVATGARAQTDTAARLQRDFEASLKQAQRSKKSS